MANSVLLIIILVVIGIPGGIIIIVYGLVTTEICNALSNIQIVDNPEWVELQNMILNILCGFANVLSNMSAEPPINVAAIQEL